MQSMLIPKPKRHSFLISVVYLGAEQLLLQQNNNSDYTKATNMFICIIHINIDTIKFFFTSVDKVVTLKSSM